MVGTTFTFDEAKVNAEGKYTLDQLHKMTDAVAAKSYLSKEEPGHYASDMEEHAFALVGRTILKLKDEPWFMENLKAWQFYGEDWEEDIIDKCRNRYYGRS